MFGWRGRCSLLMHQISKFKSISNFSSLIMKQKLLIRRNAIRAIITRTLQTMKQILTIIWSFSWDWSSELKVSNPMKDERRRSAINVDTNWTEFCGGPCLRPESWYEECKISLLSTGVLIKARLVLSPSQWLSHVSINGTKLCYLKCYKHIDMLLRPRLP